MSLCAAKECICYLSVENQYVNIIFLDYEFRK